MSDTPTNYAADELLARIGLASSGDAWKPILAAMQQQHPDFRERDKLVSAFWAGVDNAIRPLCEEVLRLRADRDAAVAEAVRVERERAAGVALALAKTRFSFSDQPWVCSEIAAAIRRGE